ncbi:MAG: carbon-nitrogen hydrolase family protein [Desulfobacteraceae bacterium]|nr:carbon-nitrogen hydrolase family protein [Desulfobacteraceae bacterium]
MTQKFTMAAAQSLSEKGDIHSNISNHTRFIEKAAEQCADVLVFPELSLTGYELELAKSCAVSEKDSCLFPLKDLAQKHQMLIAAGAPVKSLGKKPYIGELLFLPDGHIKVYKKQFLHGEEKHYFESGNDDLILPVKERRIAMAICADTTHVKHVKNAAQNGAHIYAAGVLISKQGYLKDTGMLKGYAMEYGMAVLMANHGGPTGGWVSAGKSIIFNEKGECIAAACGTGSELVLAKKEGNHWIGKTVLVEL